MKIWLLLQVWGGGGGWGVGGGYKFCLPPPTSMGASKGPIENLQASFLFFAEQKTYSKEKLKFVFLAYLRHA
jgi:hypothetical protein